MHTLLYISQAFIRFHMFSYAFICFHMFSYAFIRFSYAFIHFYMLLYAFIGQTVRRTTTRRRRDADSLSNRLLPAEAGKKPDLGVCIFDESVFMELAKTLAD